MRVLHIVPTLGSGGAEKMLVDIVREMQKQDVECEIAIFTKSHDFFGHEIEKLNIPRYYGSCPKIYSLKNIRFIKKIIELGNFDYIHTHLFAPQLFTPIALKIANKSVPLITTEHNTYNRRREKKVFYLLDFWMYKQYEKIIAITTETKQNLSSYLPNTINKTKVIENGIDISQYVNAEPLERKQIAEDLQADEKIILMVAAMREQKDHETLIRASKLLPYNYRVIFVGDGERMDDVKKYAVDHGNNSILFLGRRTDVPTIMKTSDAFVLSSKWEGFGLVVVEAAAAGLPVVASNVEGLNGVVKTIGGQVFEPFNEHDLANKIIKAVENKKESYDVSKYSIETTVKEYLKLYQESLKD